MYAIIDEQSNFFDIFTNDNQSFPHSLKELVPEYYGKQEEEREVSK